MAPKRKELDFEGLPNIESPKLPEFTDLQPMAPSSYGPYKVPIPIKYEIIPEFINVPNPKNVEELQVPTPVRPQSVVVNRTIPVYQIADPPQVFGASPPAHD